MKDPNYFFKKAKDQEPVMSRAEIRNLVQSASAREQSTLSLVDSILLLFKKNELKHSIIIFSIMTLTFTIALFLFQSYFSPSDEEVYTPDSQKRIMQFAKHLSDNAVHSQIRLIPFGEAPARSNKSIPAYLRSAYELSEEKLNRLGITTTPTRITYEGNVKGLGYLTFNVVPGKNGNEPMLMVSGIPKKGVVEYRFYPWFLSDEAGHQTVRYGFGQESGLKMTDKFFLSAIDELIPIQVQRPGFKKVVFWFSSTPEIMAILESGSGAFRGKPAAEVDIKEDVSAMEVAREVVLYPTITTGLVEVNAKINRTQKFEISVLSSAGEVLSVPVKDQLLEKGDYNFSLDLSSLRSGLYLVRIKSEPGIITVHRLFKQ